MYFVAKVKNMYTRIGQTLGASFTAPSNRQIQLGLFALGVGLLTVGVMGGAQAQPGDYNDERVAEVINRIFTYLEGSFGALVMVAAGIAAIFSAAVGQYKAALGLLIVAAGAFILRSLVGTFSNDENIGGDF